MSSTSQPPPERPARTLAARLQALGNLLDAQGFSPEGLCILAADGGFVVTGYALPERGAAYSLVQRTVSVTAADLATSRAGGGAG